MITNNKEGRAESTSPRHPPKALSSNSFSPIDSFLNGKPCLHNPIYKILNNEKD